METDETAPVLPTIGQLRSHSLAGVVQHEIERMILSGDLPAGARINENALANKLSVSRGPIREACRALAELGFVYLVPNRGVFVSHLGKSDAMEVYDLRAGLTALAGSLLAPVRTEEQIDRLQDLIDQMDKAAGEGDFSKFYPLNIAFHDLIVEAAGNSRLLKMYRRLVKEFHLFRPHGLVQRDALKASNRGHRAILRALKKRDSVKCYEVSFQHVQNGKERLLKALDDSQAERTSGEIGSADHKERLSNSAAP